MVGSALGHYRILSRLGAGGMGEVYRAADTRLGREVALKVLPAHLTRDPERLARIEREARTLAALNHRNIVTVHSIEEAEGIRFLTMELVEGQTLDAAIPRGGLPLDRFLAIATALADALAAAHERGVVHRDLKPANVMLTRDGQVKVLDFGLAKLEQPIVAADLTSLPTDTVAQLSQVGHLVGTFPYMSPEQLQGRPVDQRSDVFALGVVLYEMATGQRPFQGGTSVEVLSGILKDTPSALSQLRPGAPPELGRILRHCLEKDPDRRFQTAKDVRNELQMVREEQQVSAAAGPASPGLRRTWWAAVALGVLLLGLVTGYVVFRAKSPAAGTAVPPEDLPRLAVLPFEDLSAAEDGYFAAGMTEELLSRLAVVHGLLVLSRTTVVNYDRAGKTVPQIGRDLDVDYVLEGTVRWDRSGGRDRVRITPQLIRVADDTHLWADRYDRDMADIFAVQSDIASQIVRALGVTLSERERRLVEIRPTANLEAYQLYLRGLQAAADGQAGRREDMYLEVTADFMRRATDLDPAFALAHARRAWALAWTHFLGGPAEELAEARSALERAATLAPDRPEVRVATGYLRYWGDGDYTGALAEFDAAAAEMPSNGDALVGAGSVLRRLGRYEEAIARFERAGELGGPADMPDVWTAGDEIAICNWALRRYEAVDRYYSHQSLERRETAEYWRYWARLHVHWKGETTSAWELLAQAPATVQPKLADARALLHVMDRNFAQAVASVPPDLLQPDSDDHLVWLIAYAQLRLGHEREAADLSRRLIAYGAQRLTENPDAFYWHMRLGSSSALVGEREPALEHAQRAVDLLARDAMWGPMAEENLAVVYTLLGDHGPALDLIAELLTKSYWPPLNAQLLRLEPWWDPLRDEARFQQLLAGAGAVN